MKGVEGHETVRTIVYLQRYRAAVSGVSPAYGPVFRWSVCLAG